MTVFKRPPNSAEAPVLQGPAEPAKRPRIDAGTRLLADLPPKVISVIFNFLPAYDKFRIAIQHTSFLSFRKKLKTLSALATEDETVDWFVRGHPKGVAGAAGPGADLAQVQRSLRQPARELLGFRKILIAKISKGVLDMSETEMESSEIRGLWLLATYTGLHSLCWESRRLAGIHQIGGLTNLTSLVLNYTSVSDISALKTLTNLRVLKITVSPVKDISPLAGLVKLTHLDLGGTHVSDITPLAGLTGLLELDLSGTPLIDIRTLKVLVNLTSLSLAASCVIDTGPIAKLAKLQILDLSRTDIGDLRPIKGMVNLENLDISHLPIYDLKALSNLVGLKVLNFEDCMVYRWSDDLYKLRNLEVINGEEMPRFPRFF